MLLLSLNSLSKLTLISKEYSLQNTFPMRVLCIPELRQSSSTLTQIRQFPVSVVSRHTSKPISVWIFLWNKYLAQSDLSEGLSVPATLLTCINCSPG